MRLGQFLVLAAMLLWTSIVVAQTVPGRFPPGTVYGNPGAAEANPRTVATFTSNWTTLTRPGSPTLGSFGLNTTTGLLEYWNGTRWTNTTDGKINVQDFGAKCNLLGSVDLSHDDTPGINAAIAYAATLGATGNAAQPIEIIFPPNRECVLLTTVNLTSSAITRQSPYFTGYVLTGTGSLLACVMTGGICIDALGAREVQWDDIFLTTVGANKPAIGIQIGRVDGNVASSQKFNNLKITGPFTQASFQNYGAEIVTYNAPEITNSDTGCSYAVILDAYNHWNFTSAFVTQTNGVDVNGTQEQQVFVSGSIASSGTCSAIWMGGQTRPMFLGTYIAVQNNAALANVTLYFLSNTTVGSEESALFDVHFEQQPATAFFLTGKTGIGVTSPLIRGFRFIENVTEISTNIFKIDPASNITSVTLRNPTISIASLINTTSPPLTLFDTASNYTITGGDIRLPSANMWSAPASFTGTLCLVGVCSNSIPVQTWTTATRAASPVAGTVGFNSDTGDFEAYDGSQWNTLNPSVVDVRAFGAKCEGQLRVPPGGGGPNDAFDDSVPINSALAFVLTTYINPGAISSTGALNWNGTAPVTIQFPPNGQCILKNPLNFTGNSLLTGSAAGFSGYGIVVKDGWFYCETTGKPCIDGYGQRAIRWDNLTIIGGAGGTRPSRGMQIGRAQPNAGCDSQAFYHSRIVGEFSFAAFVNTGCESVSWDGNFFIQNLITGGYAVILDGYNHFDTTSAFLTKTGTTGTTHGSTTIDSLSVNTNTLNVGMKVTGTNIPAGATVASIVSASSITISAAATDSVAGKALTFIYALPVDTRIGMQDSYFGTGTIAGAPASATVAPIWMAGLGRPFFNQTYTASTAPCNVELWFKDNTDFTNMNQARLHMHMETINVADALCFEGPATAPVIWGFEVKTDNESQPTNSIFKIVGGSSITGVTINGLDFNNVVGFNPPSANQKVFDDASKWSVSGKVVLNHNAAGAWVEPASFSGELCIGLTCSQRLASGSSVPIGLLSATVSATGTGYVPGDRVTVSGGTASAAAVISIMRTRVITATVQTAGSGCTPTSGTATLTGFSGTGTHWTATSVPITAGGAINTGAITVATFGSYTANPILTTGGETVTVGGGGACTTPPFITLTGMGVANGAISIVGNYSAPPTVATVSVTGGSGTGATFAPVWSFLPSVVIDNGAAASSNFGIGLNALSSFTTGIANTAFGQSSLASLTTGNANTAVGLNSLAVATVGVNNVAIGSNALANVVGGTNAGGSNTAIGTAALSALIGSATNTGVANTALGSGTGGTLTTGTNNLLLGYSVASTTLTTGSQNILLGTTNNCTTTAAGTNNQFKVCAASGATDLMVGDMTAATLGLTINGVLSAVGTKTNNNAAVGQIGEFLQSSCPSPTVTATVTTPVASPGVVNWTAHGFSGTAPRSDACPVVFTGGVLPTGIVSGTTYYVIPSSITANTFQIAATVAAAYVPTPINFTVSSSGTQTGTAGVPLVTATGKNVTGLSLTAGDWDCRGSVQRTFTGTTSVTILSASISQTTDTNGSRPLGTMVLQSTAANIMGAGGYDTDVGDVRQLMSATTNVYLVANDTFTASTDIANGQISCRRMR